MLFVILYHPKNKPDLLYFFDQYQQLRSAWLSHISIYQHITSLTLGRCDSDLKNMIFKLCKCMLQIMFISTSCEIALRQHEKSTLVQVMAWCHQATSHYLGQCGTRFCNGVITSPHWVSVIAYYELLFRHDFIIYAIDRFHGWYISGPGTHFTYDFWPKFWSNENDCYVSVPDYQVVIIFCADHASMAITACAKSFDDHFVTIWSTLNLNWSKILNFFKSIKLYW